MGVGGTNVGAGEKAAQVRAQWCGLVAVPLLRLPDQQFMEEICSEEFGRVLDDVERACGAQDACAAEGARGAELLRAYVRAVRQAVEQGGEACAGVLGELVRDRTYLIRAIRPGVGAPPPYESHWATPGAGESVILDLTRTYARAGLEVSPQTHQRPDYLGIELMYFARLVEREAQASDEPARGAARAEQAAFFEGHLGRWAGDYLRAALPHAQADFFRGLLMLACALVESEATLLGRGATAA